MESKGLLVIVQLGRNIHMSTWLSWWMVLTWSEDVLLLVVGDIT